MTMFDATGSMEPRVRERVYTALASLVHPVWDVGSVLGIKDRMLRYGITTNMACRMRSMTHSNPYVCARR